MLVGSFHATSKIVSNQSEDSFLFFPASTLEDAFAQGSLCEVANPNYFSLFDVPEESLTKINACVYANAHFEHIKGLRAHKGDWSYLNKGGADGKRIDALPSLKNFVTESNNIELINYTISDTELRKHKPIVNVSLAKSCPYVTRDTLFDFEKYNNIMLICYAKTEVGKISQQEYKNIYDELKTFVHPKYEEIKR